MAVIDPEMKSAALSEAVGAFASAVCCAPSGKDARSTATVTRSGSFGLPMSPDDALPLFTGPGERLWVPAWNPTFLSGDGFARGTIFVTKKPGFVTYWYVETFDRQDRHATYFRVTPGVDIGSVDVQIDSDRNDGSIVHVTYALKGLNELEDHALKAQFSERAYAEMMNDWRSLIIANQSKIQGYVSQQ